MAGDEILFALGSTLKADLFALSFIGLILFTLLFERVVEHAKHTAARQHHKLEVLNRLFGELMILGFLSFGVVILVQSKVVRHGTDAFYAFEFAHILIFFVALMLILQAVLLFRTWGRVHELWEAAGELEPWDLMHSWYQEMGRIPLALSSVLRGGGLHMGRRVWRNVEFNVLRAVFIDRCALDQDFDYSTYLLQRLGKHIGGLVEVDSSSWVGVGGIVLVFSLLEKAGVLNHVVSCPPGCPTPSNFTTPVRWENTSTTNIAITTTTTCTVVDTCTDSAIDSSWVYALYFIVVGWLIVLLFVVMLYKLQNSFFTLIRQVPWCCMSETDSFQGQWDDLSDSQVMYKALQHIEAVRKSFMIEHGMLELVLEQDNPERAANNHDLMCLRDEMLAAPGLCVRSYSSRGFTTNSCFSGSDAVDWMMEYAPECGSRLVAVALGNRLRNACLLRHVSNENAFQDRDDLLYVLNDDDDAGKARNMRRRRSSFLTLMSPTTQARRVQAQAPGAQAPGAQAPGAQAADLDNADVDEARAEAVAEAAALQALSKMGVAPSQSFKEHNRRGKAQSESFHKKRVGNGSATAASGEADGKAKKRTSSHSSFSFMGKMKGRATLKVTPAGHRVGSLGGSVSGQVREETGIEGSGVIAPVAAAINKRKASVVTMKSKNSETPEDLKERGLTYARIVRLHMDKRDLRLIFPYASSKFVSKAIDLLNLMNCLYVSFFFVFMLGTEFKAMRDKKDDGTQHFWPFLITCSAVLPIFLILGWLSPLVLERFAMLEATVSTDSSAVGHVLHCMHELDELRTNFLPEIRKVFRESGATEIGVLRCFIKHYGEQTSHVSQPQLRTVMDDEHVLLSEPQMERIFRTLDHEGSGLVSCLQFCSLCFAPEGCSADNMARDGEPEAPEPDQKPTAATEIAVIGNIAVATKKWGSSFKGKGSLQGKDSTRSPPSMKRKPTRKASNLLHPMSFQKKSKKGKANAKRSNMALALVRAQQTAHDTVKQVFLGGSCNPTTWRKDIAIPILEAAKITYYNPQVDEWTPDLMQIEAHAKRDAEMLFYVVDANTRAVASMNEVVECICRNRKIVLVVQNMEASNELTRDEAGSEALLKDLNRGRDYLRDIARRNAVRCHETVEDGIEEVVRRLKPDFIYNKPGIQGLARKRLTGQSMSNRKMDIHGTPSSKTKRRRSSVGFIAQSAPAMHEPRKVNAFRTQHAQFASDVLRSSTRRSMSQRRLRQAQQTPSPSEGTSMRRLPEAGQAEE